MLFVEGFNGCDRVLIQLPVDGLRDMHTPVQSEGLDRFKLVLKTIGELIVPDVTLGAPPVGISKSIVYVVPDMLLK